MVQGTRLVPLSHPVLRTYRGGSRRGSEGAGQGGPSPVISVLGFARGELWKAKEKKKEMVEVEQGQRVLCGAVSPPWVHPRAPGSLLKGHSGLLTLLGWPELCRAFGSCGAPQTQQGGQVPAQSPS